MPFNNKRTAMMRIVPREDSTIVRAHSRSAYATSVVRPCGLARVGNAVMRIFRRQSSKVSTDGKKYGKMFPPSLQLEQVMSETDLVISEEQASADELCCMGSPRASSQGTPLAAVVDNADTAYAKQLQEQYRQKQQLKKLQAEVAKQAATQAATGPVPMSSREDFDSNAYGQKLLEHSRHKKMLKKHLKFMEEAEVAKAADAARHATEAKEAVLLGEVARICAQAEQRKQQMHFYAAEVAASSSTSSTSSASGSTSSASGSTSSASGSTSSASGSTSSASGSTSSASSSTSSACSRTSSTSSCRSSYDEKSQYSSIFLQDVPLGSWKPISSMKSTWTPKDPLVTAEGSAGEGARNCKSICWSRRKHLLVTAVRANAAPSHSPIPVPQLTPASLNTLSHCPPRAPLLTACDAFELTEVYGLAAWAIRGCGGWCETE